MQRKQKPRKGREKQRKGNYLNKTYLDKNTSQEPNEIWFVTFFTEEIVTSPSRRSPSWWPSARRETQLSSVFSSLQLAASFSE